MKSSLSNLTWQDIDSNDIDLVVLPWGATEAHNFHLPYGTDNFIAKHVATKAADIINIHNKRIIVLPEIPFGVNNAQINVKLNINLNHSTQLFILRDIVDSLERQGFRKLVIVNGHGGNSFVPMVRELFSAFEMFITVVNTYQILNNKEFFNEPGDHAGEMETSLMFNIKPESVKPLGLAGDGEFKKFKIPELNEGWCWAQRDWLRITRDHGVGNPILATKEKGDKCLNAMVSKVSKLFQSLLDVDLDDLYE